MTRRMEEAKKLFIMVDSVEVFLLVQGVRMDVEGQHRPADQRRISRLVSADAY